MSFSRAKIGRFNEHSAASKDNPSQNVTKPLGKTQKTEKWAPPPFKSARITPMNKPLTQRSLSQPTSATAIRSKFQRSQSNGDNKTCVLAKRPGSANPKSEERLSIREGEDEDDDVEYKSATVLKDVVFETGEIKFEADKNSVCDSDAKSTINDGTVKATVSGIPLRIRQEAQTNRKPTSPSVVKTISHSSTISSKTRTANASRSSLSPEPKSADRRILETQFQTRKRRLDLMRKELLIKQKLVKDSHQMLVHLKQKLEESGNTKVVLEELVLGEEKVENISEPHCKNRKTAELNPEIVQNMTQVINDIPISLVETCRHLLTKRMTLLNTLEKVSDHLLDQDDLQHSIKVYQQESAKLEKMLEDKFSDQEKQINDLVSKWQLLLKNSGDATTIIHETENLQKRLIQQEHKITNVNNELQQMIQLKEQYERKSIQAEALTNELKDKIKRLEHEASNEKSSILSQKEKCNSYEQKMKTMKTRMQELESKSKENETKYNELQKTFKQTQEQLKANEHRWTKEKEELASKNKHDRQLLDKLTKDRTFFEARAKTLEKNLEDVEKKRKNAEFKLRNELSSEKRTGESEKSKIENIQKKYEHVKEQLTQMELKNAQLELKNKQTYEPSETDGITTDREAELYTELLATRVALKAAEDQIQSYNREKIRFIDSIQLLQGDPDKQQDSVARTLIKKVETITELESKLVETEDTVCSQKIEIANLIAEIENLKQRAIIPNIQEETVGAKENDLKLMLHEGKLKLEQSLKKSLDYEHKIIKYEHDLNRQSKQICEMENLLKVRDGLISMIKSKKDELQMENDSLNKYANEIRDLLIQAKEEARNRTELVQELTVNLDTRGRICQQLEKKVKELETSLSSTNEKRFKLQDTLGATEKELQLTKARIINMNPELQSRVRLKSNRKW